MLLITVFALPVSCGREAGSTRNGDLDRVCPLRARARVPTARAECPILERMFGPLVEQAPEQCPNAHPWGPNKVLVGWMPCHCHPPAHGHRTYICRACEAIIYRPEHRDDTRS